MDGLGDYDRVKGFGAGSVELRFETRKMTMDRARTFSIDSMDVDETNFLATAANVMGEFQRTKVVPEIDAYRYSKIAQYGIANNRITDGYAPTESTILKQFTEDIYRIKDSVGDDVELVASMNSRVHQILINNDKIQKSLETGSFSRNEIKFDFRKLDGTFIKLVPSERMMTEYLFKSGKLGTDQEIGGFKATNNARQINWIICARAVPIAITKQDKVRIFVPDENQQADAYKLDYRRYHDLWILPQQMNKLWVNLQ